MNTKILIVPILLGLTFTACKKEDPSNSIATANIEGKVKNDFGDNSTITLTIKSNAFPDKTITADANGNYLFTNVPTGKEYEIVVTQKDNTPLALSTFDLVILSKTVLDPAQLQTLSQDKLAALDFNKSNTIDANDINALRGLTLGLPNQVPDAGFFRFITDDYVFPLGTNAGKGKVNSIEIKNFIGNTTAPTAHAVRIGLGKK